jgi:hypothetical protein
LAVPHRPAAPVVLGNLFVWDGWIPGLRPEIQFATLDPQLEISNQAMVTTELAALPFDQLIDERDGLRLASCQVLEHLKTMSVFLDGFVDDGIPNYKGNLKGLIHFMLGCARTKRDE